MLYHTVAHARPGVDIIQVVCKVGAAVDPAHIVHGFEAVVRRHAIFRTGFRWQDTSDPVQEVHEHAPLPVERIDLRDHDPEARDRALDEFLEPDRQRGFDLLVPPLMRLTLFRVADEQFWFVWSFHHLLLDGRSIFIVLNELFDIVETLRAGSSASLPAPIEFRRYIEWLETKHAREWSDDAPFWRNKLAGFDEALTLDVEPPSAPSTEPGRSVEKYLSFEASELVRRVARDAGVTMNTIAQLAWSLVLARYTGESDVVFGATRACRHVPIDRSDDIVGMFINTLPVRLQFSANTTAREALGQLRQFWLDVRPHEHTPLTRIQSWSDVARGTPLFKSVLVAENFDWKEELRKREGLAATCTWDIVERTNFPLTLAVDLGPRIFLLVEYDTALFSSHVGTRILAHVEQAFRSICEGLDEKLVDLEVLPDDERMQLLQHTGRPLDVPAKGTVAKVFEQTVRAHGHRTAVSCGETKLTYRELEAQSSVLAAKLNAVGVASGTVVAMCTKRDMSLPVAVAGIFRSGGVYLPIDPEYPRDRIDFILKDANVRCVVVHEELAERFTGVDATLAVVKSTGEFAGTRDGLSRPQSSVSVEGAYIIYTSGSTGKPNGVLVSQSALLNHALAMASTYELGPGDRVPQFASLSFDVSLEEFWPTWLVGAEVVLRPDALMAQDEFQAWVTNERFTVLNLPTAYWNEWVRYLSAEARKCPNSVRLVVVGGEAAASSVYELWCKVAGNARFMNAYGPTEATITCTVFDPEKSTASLANFASLPIGDPIANMRAIVMNKLDQLVPSSVAGELRLAGAGLAIGYCNRPELTSLRFVTRPFGPRGKAVRLYKTGDRVRRTNDGALEFLGRVDTQVKIRGYRIELGEVESVLLQHPDVSAAVAITHKDGMSQKLVAYVASKHRLGSAELRSFVKERLPDHAVPSVIICLEALPTTPNGKLDRKALPSPVASLRPVVSQLPRTPTEELLLRIWREVLDNPNIGLGDNFFDVGGHSLLTLQVAARAGHAGLHVTPEHLFQAQTVAELARVVTAKSAFDDGEWSSLVALRKGGTRPPLYLVHSTPGDVFGYINLVGRLGPDQPCFGLQSLGLQRPHAAHQRIETMAAYYIEQIKALQPKGPYFLGGWCYGGVVAYEMAQQLQERHNDVALVALIDAVAPSPAKGAAIYYADRIQRILYHGPKGVAAFVGDRVRREVRERFLNTREVLQVEVDSGPLANRAFVTDVNMHAIRVYRPLPYNGPVVLFRSTDRQGAGAFDETLGWATLVKHIEVHEFEAGHATILREPSVSKLADALSAYLKSPRPNPAPPRTAARTAK